MANGIRGTTAPGPAVLYRNDHYNDFVLRTLIRGKDAWPYAIGRVSDKASDARRLPNGSLTAEHENDR